MTHTTEILPNKLRLLVTGTGQRTKELTSDLLLRTDDATLNFKKDSEFGKLANALIDRYNERQKLLEVNGDLVETCKEILKAFKVHGDYDLNNIPVDATISMLTTVINKARRIINKTKNI